MCDLFFCFCLRRKRSLIGLDDSDSESDPSGNDETERTTSSGTSRQSRQFDFEDLSSSSSGEDDTKMEELDSDGVADMAAGIFPPGAFGSFGDPRTSDSLPDLATVTETSEGDFSDQPRKRRKKPKKRARTNILHPGIRKELIDKHVLLKDICVGL